MRGVTARGGKGGVATSSDDSLLVVVVLNRGFLAGRGDTGDWGTESSCNDVSATGGGVTGV